ncbi:MAG: pre-peptidase C-terminal domain-containing protein, partial [Jatrophihabitans sp.]
MTSRLRALGTVAALGTATALIAVAPAALAAPPSNGESNPYSPAHGHSYRHGVIPTRAVQQRMQHWAASQPAAATGSETLSYGGGVDGIGVQSGHSKVYLVFYGTQWGTQTTTNGISSFSGDANGAAQAAQNMFKGIGTNNELWSADLTQWCDGAGVASGATSCPASGASYIPYQSGGVLSGVWYDNSKASPSSATAAQLGQEAVSAAAHFGNTTAASNRDAYYVILSPHGTNPDNYQSPTQGYCAWHDYNGDVGVSSPYGDIAFSNQPYNIDMGASCGTNFINSGTAGKLDGWTMTLGHEWHEMMSDQNPAGGWTNHQTLSSYYQQENSDECAWIAPGQTGGAANVSFGSFGSYAEQASWSND